MAKTKEKTEMKIGVPTEIKNNEYRVAVTPAGVRELAARGHNVYVQAGAGLGSGMTDQEYTAAGAEILASAAEVFASADMIVKVKEPLSSELDNFRSGQILFTYLHLAAVPELADALLKKGVTGVAYETIQLAGGGLPLLIPMSMVAGRLSVQEGASHLKRTEGGRGVLLGGVPGVERSRVVILGGGTVGINAAKMALGMGADVCILDLNTRRLEYLDDVFGGHISTLASNQFNVAQAVRKADLVIGGVLVPGSRAPRLITREMIASMKPGAVIVDVAVDQGGCVEGLKATTHDNPTYVQDGVTIYAVANMPGAVARTSTFALTNATLPYVLKLADLGFRGAMANDPSFALGVNLHEGKVCHPAVAESLGLDYSPLDLAA